MSMPSAKCMRSCWHPLPLHISWSLHPSSVDALVDIHRRSHNFPLIHPREVLLAWCWVITRPLSTHGIFSLSLPLGVGLTGVGLVHQSHAWWTPTHKGMSSLWCNEKKSIAVEDAWLSALVCHFIGGDVCHAIWCTTSHVSSSYLSLIFLFPLKASAFTKTRSPGFSSMAPIFQS